MKYRIRKFTHSYLCNDNDKSNKLGVKKHTDIWYQASRKGKLFGFWHAIGHEYDWDGEVYAHKTKTLEAMEEYIKLYHEVEYKDEDIEIIKEIEI